MTPSERVLALATAIGIGWLAAVLLGGPRDVEEPRTTPSPSPVQATPPTAPIAADVAADLLQRVRRAELFEGYNVRFQRHAALALVVATPTQGARPVPQEHLDVVESVLQPQLRFVRELGWRTPPKTLPVVLVEDADFGDRLDRRRPGQGAFRGPPWRYDPELAALVLWSGTSPARLRASSPAGRWHIALVVSEVISQRLTGHATNSCPLWLRMGLRLHLLMLAKASASPAGVPDDLLVAARRPAQSLQSWRAAEERKHREAGDAAPEVAPYQRTPERIAWHATEPSGRQQKAPWMSPDPRRGLGPQLDVACRLFVVFCAYDTEARAALTAYCEAIPKVVQPETGGRHGPSPAERHAQCMAAFAATFGATDLEAMEARFWAFVKKAAR